MKEWNKKGGQRRKRGWMGVTQWKRLSFTVFISFRVIIFAQSKTLSYAYIYMNCLSHSVPLTCSFAIMRERQRKAIHLSVAAP